MALTVYVHRKSLYICRQSLIHHSFFSVPLSAIQLSVLVIGTKHLGINQNSPLYPHPVRITRIDQGHNNLSKNKAKTGAQKLFDKQIYCVGNNQPHLYLFCDVQPDLFEGHST